MSQLNIFLSDRLKVLSSSFSRMRPSMSSPRGMYSKEDVIYIYNSSINTVQKLLGFDYCSNQNGLKLKRQSKYIANLLLSRGKGQECAKCSSKSSFFLLQYVNFVIEFIINIEERMLNYSSKSRPILDALSKTSSFKQNTPNTPEIKRLAFRPSHLELPKKTLTSTVPTYDAVLTPKTARTSYQHNTLLTDSTYSKSPRLTPNKQVSRKEGSFILTQAPLQGYLTETAQSTVMDASKRGQFKPIDNVRQNRPSKTVMFKQVQKEESDVSRLRQTVTNASSWLTRNNMPPKPVKSQVDFEAEGGKNERSMRKKIESEYLPSTKKQTQAQQQNEIPISTPGPIAASPLTASKYVPRNHNRTKSTFEDPSPSPSTISKQQKSQNTTPRISQQKLGKSVNLKLDKMNKTDSSYFQQNLTKRLSSTTQRESTKEKSFSLQDFQLGPCKGQGRFGKVFPARHKKTGFLLAVKQVKKEGVRLMLEQFIQEIKISLFLTHPNVVKFYGFFQDSLNFYILMEYMEDGSLYRLIKGGKKMRQQEAIPKLAEVCQAVGYLHSLDILHRDIKPENIVISNGVCKLCDFGWATYSRQRRTTYCGTLDYVCPQILQGQSYDSLVDIWAIGVLAFELLTGKAPFYHISRQQTMRSIMKCEFGFPQEMSQAARGFIARSLQRDAGKRVTIEELLRDKFLEEGLRGFQ